MAASPLAAALLGGEGGSGFTDPTAAAAMPDIQLGQALQQGSLSTAPASPWQAVARLGQALAGGYIQKSALSDLAKAYAHTADNMAQIFPEGTPVGNMLRSKDPTVRMMGMQQAGKAAIIGQEGYGLSAGEARYQGPVKIASSDQPQSAEGKKIKDAAALAASGNRPAANAITSTISKEGQIGETGVAAPPVPLSAPRFGGMNSVVGAGPGGPGTPSAVPPQRPAGVPLTAPNLIAGAGPGGPNAGVPLSAPQVQAQNVKPPSGPVPTNLQPAIPQPTPDQMSAAKQFLGKKLQQVADSGITNPSATGVSATAAPSLPAQIAASKAEQAEATKTVEANAKYYDSLHRGLSGSAMIAAQQKQNIDLLRQVAASPNFKPGVGSDQATQLQRIASQFGINPAGAAPREIFNQVAARVLADQMSGIKSMASETGEAGGRIFKPMLDLEEKANITPEDSLEGIKAKLNLLDHAGDLMMKWGDKADDYIKDHGKLDAGFDKALRADIAQARIPNIVPTTSAGAGSTKAGGAGGATGATAAPAGPAVGYVHNGYKFLGGDPNKQASWEKVTP
jgi:hypothetical protein